MDARIEKIRKANAQLLLDIIHADGPADYEAIRKAQEAISEELDKLEAVYGKDESNSELTEEEVVELLELIN